ncbi:hypothetical protein [Actinoplanes sp. NPDC049599]|uniref:hypothetical protein n=1 Tax=Actinoplanes sp. NPDC049599 TaxID=3363903 RepID=UPI0037A51D23
MRSVLLLGGVDATTNRRYLDAVTGRGLTPLVVDTRTGNWPGGVPSAPLEAIRITEIADQAATWSGRHTIAGVWAPDPHYTDAAAVVADLLGLPSPGLRAAAACHHPHLRRRYLPEWSPVDPPAGPAYAVESLSVQGVVRRVDVFDPEVTAGDRRLLVAAHRTVLARITFGTGAIRAAYRQEPGRVPALTALAVQATERPGAEDEVIGLCLGVPSLTG